MRETEVQGKRKVNVCLKTSEEYEGVFLDKNNPKIMESMKDEDCQCKYIT